MGALEEAQQRFHRAAEALEQAHARAAERRRAEDEAGQALSALKSEYAALEAEHKALRKQYKEISQKLDEAIAGLREVLDA